MVTTFKDLLEELVAYRHRDYRSDPEREAARLDAIEFVLQRTLEKLRDMHDNSQQIYAAQIARAGLVTRLELNEEAAREITKLRQLLLTALALHGGEAHTYSEKEWRKEARTALGLGKRDG